MKRNDEKGVTYVTKIEDKGSNGFEEVLYKVQFIGEYGNN